MATQSEREGQEQQLLEQLVVDNETGSGSWSLVGLYRRSLG